MHLPIQPSCDLTSHFCELINCNVGLEELALCLIPIEGLMLLGESNAFVLIKGSGTIVGVPALLRGDVRPVYRFTWPQESLGENMFLVSKVATWLILPVVICLSQRLSHACLSINTFVLWNCEWLIKSVIVYLIVPYYLDNRGNSRANTC